VFKLGDGVDRACPQGACDGRLVRTARAAKGALHRGVRPNRHVTLGNGLGPAGAFKQKGTVSL